jgi:hypothetical protein
MVAFSGPPFDRQVWMPLVAMLSLRVGQGLYYPFSTIYFHTFVGISLSLVRGGLAALAAAGVASDLVCGPLTEHYGREAREARRPRGERCNFCRLPPTRTRPYARARRALGVTSAIIALRVAPIWSFPLPFEAHLSRTVGQQGAKPQFGRFSFSGTVR